MLRPHFLTQPFSLLTPRLHSCEGESQLEPFHTAEQKNQMFLLLLVGRKRPSFAGVPLGQHARQAFPVSERF